MLNTEWNIPTWDELFMRHAYLIASKSKDLYTKIGCVVVKDNITIMEGFNGIPRKVLDTVLVRSERPEKYFWYEHSERNAIFNCARKGIATEDATMYCLGMPCSECMRAIIQAYIKELVIHSQWEDIGMNVNSEKWNESTRRSNIMLKESGINFRILDKKLGIKTMVDGKIYDV